VLIKGDDGEILAKAPVRLSIPSFETDGNEVIFSNTKEQRLNYSFVIGKRRASCHLSIIPFCRFQPTERVQKKRQAPQLAAF